MPSQFESLIASNLPALYAQYGLDATYTPPNGQTPTTGLSVRVHRGDSRQYDRGNGSMGEIQTAEVIVLQSALPRPVAGGRFTVESVEVWTIDATPTLKNGQFTCTCTRTGDSRLMSRSAKDV